MSAILREFWLFLREEKKWWLVPLLLAMAVVGVLVVIAAVHPAAAPFLYTFF